MQKIMPKTKEKLNTKDYITLSISILAICLTSFGFYFQYFRVNHSLKVSVSADLDDWSSSKAVMTIHGVFANYGNRTEIMTFGTAKIPSSIGSVQLGTIGPIVLMPGEASTFEIKDSIAFALDNAGFNSINKDTIYLNPEIEFGAVSTEGYKKTLYTLETFCYFKPSDNWTPKNKSQEKNFFWTELLK
jgi:hypothetical protein